MRQVLELWDMAHEAYLRARSVSDEAERRRMLAEADGYLKQAEILRVAREAKIKISAQIAC